MAYDRELEQSYLTTIRRLDIRTAIKRNTEVFESALPAIDEILTTQKLDKQPKDVTEAVKELQNQTDKAIQKLKVGGDKYTKVQDIVKKASSELPDQIESLVSNTGLSDLPSDIDKKLSDVTSNLTDSLNLLDFDLLSGLLDPDSALKSIFSEDLTKQLSSIPLSALTGNLGQGIANLSDGLDDLSDKLKGGLADDLTKNLSSIDFSAIKGNLDDLSDKLKGGLADDLTKKLSDIPLSVFKGGLGQGLADIKENLDGLSDKLRGSLKDVENIMTGELKTLLSSKEFDITNFQSLNTVFKALEASGGDLKNFMSELEKSGHIIRGNTVSGLRTVPSAIQSRQTKPGQRQSIPYTTNSNSNPASSVSGGQPGRLEGTRVSAVSADPRHVPRQEIVDALDYVSNELDIYVQITGGGGWHPRPRTKNHPTGWAADFQVLKDGGGIIQPQDDPVLYGEIAAILKHYGYGKGKTPGIGEYIDFIHYDEYPPRTAAYYPKLKAVHWHWGVRWNMLKQIEEAEKRLGLG